MDETKMAVVSDRVPGVTGGVDTHLDLHVCVAVCSVTMRRLGAGSFPATSDGYRELLSWLESFGTVDRVGIEGTGTYGAGLSRHLAGQGVAVVEVNRPDRSGRRLRGKSDDVDAEAAARAVLSGQATAVPKSHDGAVEAIRVLRVVYVSAVKDRTAAINQFHAVVSTAPEPMRDELAGLTTTSKVDRVSRWRERTSDGIVAATTRRALRELAARVTMLDEQAERLDTDLTRLVEATAPALVDLAGVGVHTAAELLVAAGDNPTRLRNEAAFAHLCGAAPVPASSGRTHRNRLNFAGNRAANHALWRIVMARMAHRDPRTIAYVERRVAEGLAPAVAGDDEGTLTSASVAAEKAVERRGRPRKWESDAERKRAYRERLAADFAEPDRLRRELRNERRRMAARDRELAQLRGDLERSEAEIVALGCEKEDLVDNQASLEPRLEFFEAKASRADKRLSDELRKDPKHPFHGRS